MTRVRGGDFAIPPVVIAGAQVNSLVVEYQEVSPGTLHPAPCTLHRFTLDNVFIDDVSADGSVEKQIEKQAK